jgi:hypothetical protein
VADRPQLNLDVRHHPFPVRISAILAFVGVISCGRSPDSAAAGAHILADSSCAFVRTAMHPDAVRLLKEFVARDARGEFIRSREWFNAAVACPGHQPAWDDAVMARNPRMSILTRGTNTVRALVVWERLGYVGPGSDAMAPGVDSDTLVALRTPYGWRIASPTPRPHVPVPPPPRP